MSPLCVELGFTDLVTAKKRKPTKTKTTRKKPVSLGMRWPVERTNSWMSNFGQLRRNTDRFIHHRLDQIALAVALSSPSNSSNGPTAGARTRTSCPGVAGSDLPRLGGTAGATFSGRSSGD